MDFAVIKISGKQHLVKVGDLVTVDANLGEVGKKLTVSEVLLISTGSEVKIGTPMVIGAEVQTEIISSGKGKKIDVFKFKAKSRYRRAMGFRPLETKLKILSLEPVVKAKKSPVKKAKDQKEK